jgi:hypothetical protein
MQAHISAILVNTQAISASGAGTTAGQHRPAVPVLAPSGRRKSDVVRQFDEIVLIIAEMQFIASTTAKALGRSRAAKANPLA